MPTWTERWAERWAGRWAADCTIDCMLSILNRLSLFIVRTNRANCGNYCTRCGSFQCEKMGKNSSQYRVRTDNKLREQIAHNFLLFTDFSLCLCFRRRKRKHRLNWLDNKKRDDTINKEAEPYRNMYNIYNEDAVQLTQIQWFYTMVIVYTNVGKYTKFVYSTQIIRLESKLQK